MIPLLACLSIFAAGAQGRGGIPKPLLDKLTRGVNITRWFCYLDHPKDAIHFETYFLPQDISKLHQLKVQYLRLCVSPEAIYDHGKPDAQNGPILHKVVRAMVQRGFVVILDLHDNGQMKLDQPGHDNSGFITFWQSMAREYRRENETSLVFELLNEPPFQKNPDDWYKLQEQTVRAVREIDPRRTVMVTSTSWSSIDTLATMKPLPEKNLIYTFHCYDPFFFTHQGASWVGPEPHEFKNMPFPSSPEAVAKMIDTIPPQHRPAVEWYGRQRFDARYLHDRLKKAMDWGFANGVFVLLGEFGSYPLVAPKAARCRWFDAMNAAFADLNVPNCLWGYDDAMGLGRTRTDAGIKIDQSVIDHLYPDTAVPNVPQLKPGK